MLTIRIYRNLTSDCEMNNPLKIDNLKIYYLGDYFMIRFREMNSIDY